MQSPVRKEMQRLIGITQDAAIPNISLPLESVVNAFANDLTQKGPTLHPMRFALNRSYSHLGTTNWPTNSSTTLHVNRILVRRMFRWCMRFVDSGSTHYKQSGGNINLVRVKIKSMLPSVCKNREVAQDPDLARILGGKL